MTSAQIKELVGELAVEQGFCGVGIARPDRPVREDYFRRWLAAGNHGSMDYLARNQHIRLNPASILDPPARSMIVVAHPYGQAEQEKPTDQPRGRVAMYAWGRDYHKVVKKKLFAVCDRLHDRLNSDFKTRVMVDTAPVIERELALAAGIGWIGKNTMIIHPRRGSYFFLGVIATTLELAPDSPITDHCGSCTRCLDACPTGAFPAPYRMDASRCISYLTIEHRGEIAEEFHADMGDWVFGCDVCQQVCPYNGKFPAYADSSYQTREPAPFPSLHELLEWGEEDRRARLQGSAMKRAKLHMLHRNARIALDNLGGDEEGDTPGADR